MKQSKAVGQRLQDRRRRSVRGRADRVRPCSSAGQSDRRVEGHHLERRLLRLVPRHRSKAMRRRLVWGWPDRESVPIPLRATPRMPDGSAHCRFPGSVRVVQTARYGRPAPAAWAVEAQALQGWPVASDKGRQPVGWRAVKRAVASRVRSWHAGRRHHWWRPQTASALQRGHPAATPKVHHWWVVVSSPL